MATAKKKRGKCVCGRSFDLRADGKIPVHDHTTMDTKCPGSGEAPA